MPTTYPNHVELTVAQILSERPSVRRFYNADGSNVVGDGVILFDASINAGSRVVVSPAANWTSDHIGKLLWIEGAGPDGTADLLTTIAAISSPTSVELAADASFSVANAECRYGTNNTTGLQYALDSASLQRGIFLTLPRGLYLTTGTLQLRSNLTLEGDGHCYTTYNGDAVSCIMCCVDAPVFEGNSIDNFNIRDFALRGTKRSGSKGIYINASLGGRFRDIVFDHFGDQALQMVNGIFGYHITGCNATGSCLVRTRSDYVGVFELEPTDLFMHDCEVGASFPHGHGEEFGDGKIAAFCFRGADNSFISHLMAHHSQVGIYVGFAASGLQGAHTTFVNCRTDHNQGHGWVIDVSACSFDGCRSFADGQDADGTYDAFRILRGSNRLNHCRFNNYYYPEHPVDPPTLYSRYKHGFHTITPAEYQPNQFSLCTPPSTVACTDNTYQDDGAQKQTCVSYQTNEELPGRRTNVFRGDVLLGTEHAYDGWLFFKTSDENALTDEKIWALRTNYGVDFKNLMISMFSDDMTAEVIPFYIQRSGMGVVSIYLNSPQLFLTAGTFYVKNVVVIPGGYVQIQHLDANRPLVSNASKNIATDEQLNAVWIGDGSVNNTEFQYLGGVTSDIQAQINALDARLDALEGAGGGYVTIAQHNAHDHFYTGDGSGTVSDHTSTANPTL